ncbi:hypothetical protein V8F06_005261 [Rhypophila decipiens]
MASLATGLLVATLVLLLFLVGDAIERERILQEFVSSCQYERIHKSRWRQVRSAPLLGGWLPPGYSGPVHRSLNRWGTAGLGRPQLAWGLVPKGRTTTPAPPKQWGTMECSAAVR